MKYLFIDTSSFFINITLINNNEIVFQHIEKIEKDMSSKILPIIRNGFKEVKMELRDIDKIFVVNGPGSFTGVRVGVTVAKTIGFSLNIPIIPLSSLEVIASTETSKKYNVATIDARRGNVFAGIYDNNLNCIKGDQLINLNLLLNETNDDYEILSYENENIKPNILKVVNKNMNNKCIDAHLLTPNYLKKTEAEEKLNDSRNK